MVLAMFKTTGISAYAANMHNTTTPNITIMMMMIIIMIMIMIMITIG